MKSSLNYDNLIHLDAEALAEGGITEAYSTILPRLHHYIAQPAIILEQINPASPSYRVTCQGIDYPIYSPEIPNDEGQSWGRATYAFFTIINKQLEASKYRLFAINGGNDLGAMFLTQSECDQARRSLQRPEDWPWIPTLEHPWYGQPHS